MSLFLENKAWLGLLGLVLVPLLIHLLARTRPPRFVFSSVEFLRRVVRRSSRMRKPQDFLTWLLRTLAVLAIVLAFLGPMLLSDETSIPGAERSVVIVVDRSGSMAGPAGVGTRFSAACEEAVSYLKELRPDTANLVWLDSRPEASFPKPGPNAAFLIESLNRAEVRQEQGAIDLALRLAIEQLGEAEGERELVLISDFQASAWKDVDLAVPQGMKLIKRQVGTALNNTAIEDLFVSPTDPVAGQQVNVVARVQNYSDTPRRVPLYLDAGGGRQSRTIELPAWGAGEAVFTTRFQRPGEILLAASLEADDFPADDRRHAVLNVKESLELVVVAESEEAAWPVWEALGQALPWLRVRRDNVSPAPDSVDFVYVEDWSGSDLDAWEALAKSGTVLLIEPGTQTSGAALRSLAGLDANGEGILAVESEEDGWQVEIAAPEARMFSLFRNGEFGNPVGGRFRSRAKLPPGWAEEVGTVLARYEDGTPGLVRWGQGRRVVYWGLPLASDESTWADQSPFLPFIGEFLLSERLGSLATPAIVRSGMPITWRPGDEVAGSQISLRQGDEVWDTESDLDEDGAILRSSERSMPGVYKWMMGTQVATHRVVNYPETESDLRSIDATEVTGSAESEEALSRRAALTRGWPVWPWMIATALIALLGESVVTMWKPRMKEAAL